MAQAQKIPVRPKKRLKATASTTRTTMQLSRLEPRAKRVWPSGHRTGVPQINLLDTIGFTIPPAWLCHAVPPLHKGGFSLPFCIQPALSVLLGQDCTLASIGGAEAPRITTHKAGESMPAEALRA